ncbi:MAG: hypothetical protein ACI8PT_001814 [Gammaproteobacteria bacterium]
MLALGGRGYGWLVGAIAFLVEIRQADHDLVSQWQRHVGARYAFCTLGVQKYWVSEGGIRFQSFLEGRPGRWHRPLAVEETDTHFFLLDDANGAHVFPKRMLDRAVSTCFQELRREVSRPIVPAAEGILNQIPNQIPDQIPDQIPPADATMSQRDAALAEPVDWRAAAVSGASAGPAGTATPLQVRARARLYFAISNVLAHVWAGIRFSLTLRVPQAPTAREMKVDRTKADESTPLLSLLAILLVAVFVVDFLLVPRPRWFYIGAFTLHASWLVVALAATYIAVRFAHSSLRALGPFLGLLLPGLLVPVLVGKLYMNSQGAEFDILGREGAANALWWALAWCCWVAQVALRALRYTAPVPMVGAGAMPALKRVRRSWVMALFALVTVVFCALVVPGYPFFIPYDDSAEQTSEPSIDIESIYYVQRERLDTALSRLQPQRPGIRDLYFVGFAGYADQDVFMREVRHFQTLMDTELGTQNRSVLLINNESSLQDAPLASRFNLAKTLKHVGNLIDPDEDTVFLYMTSHGSRDGYFSVRFEPLGLRDLDGADVNKLLVEAKIGRRVVAVSACFSGTFIEPLAAADALIMTAARADRTSFGCANGRDFTYFGKALRDGLSQADSFEAAFEIARAQVKVREEAEEKEPSFPQISIGSRFSQ